jgi:hypothetical protein
VLRLFCNPLMFDFRISVRPTAVLTKPFFLAQSFSDIAGIESRNGQTPFLSYSPHFIMFNDSNGLSGCLKNLLNHTGYRSAAFSGRMIANNERNLQLEVVASFWKIYENSTEKTEIYDNKFH